MYAPLYFMEAKERVALSNSSFADCPLSYWSTWPDMVRPAGFEPTPGRLWW